MNIIPLSEKYLEETIAMTAKVFPGDVDKLYNPDRSFRLSLRIKENPGLLKKRGLSRIGYWIVINEKDEVIAVTGLYRPGDEDDDVIWLGWYCVREDNRGKGLGRKLLEWTIEKARSEGFKKLKLYTSNDPSEALAQDLYEKLGFKIVGEKSVEANDAQGSYKEFYREKILTK